MAASKPTDRKQEPTAFQAPDCQICHNPLSDVSITHCGHRFCTPCITQWLRQRNTCPICRKKTTDKELIADREFTELIRVFNEREKQQQQAAQRGAVSLENVSQILQSVMPQRDQDLRDRTDNLLDMKTQEVDRLKALSQEQVTQIGQLKRDKDRLQGQIDNEIPGLKERLREQQEKVERKRGQKRILKDKITELQHDLTVSRNKLAGCTAEKQDLVESKDDLQEELDELKQLLEDIRIENKKMEMEIQGNEETIKHQQAVCAQTELTKDQMREWFDRVLQQKQVSDTELMRTKQLCMQLQQQALQLQQYQTLYTQNVQELKDLRENIVPSKDALIFEMQLRTEELLAKLAYYSQNNVPMNEHVEKLQSETKKAIEELKHHYDTLYGSRITATENRNDELEKRNTELENELGTRETHKGDLEKATDTYKKLLKENSWLHDEVKQRDTELKRLNIELQHSRKRLLTLERKISSETSLRED